MSIDDNAAAKTGGPMRIFIFKSETSPELRAPITLAELADEFGVSRERVRQIDVRSFELVAGQTATVLQLPAAAQHQGRKSTPQTSAVTIDA